MSGECAGRKGVRPPRPKTKGAVLCGSAPLNGCGFGGGAAKRRPRFLASLPWFRTTGLLACPRSPPSLPRGFPSSGPMGSSGLQWRVRAGFSPASRASCGESPSGFRPDIMTFRRSLSRKGISDEHRRAAGSVTGARLGRRRTLSSVTTAPETDIPVGFSALALCPATLPLPGEISDLGFDSIQRQREGLPLDAYSSGTPRKSRAVPAKTASPGAMADSSAKKSTE